MPGLVLGAGESARNKAITTSPLGREENVSHQVDASSWVQGMVINYTFTQRKRSLFLLEDTAPNSGL